MGFLNKPIGWIINLCYKIVPNYAIALFFFALIIKVILFPFGIKQQKNMLRQAKLRPKEMAIRKKYAGRDDQVTKQKMQQDLMNLYQSENYNPASGCLPMILQLVILFAVYGVMRAPLTYVTNYSNAQVNNLGIQVVELYAKDEIKLEGVVSKNVLKAVEEQVKNLNKEDAKVKNPFAEQVELIRVIRANDIEKFITADEGKELLPKGTKHSDLPNFTILGGRFDLSETPSMDSFNRMLIIPVLTFVFTFGSMKLTKKLSYQPAIQQGADAGCSMKIMDYVMPLMSTFLTFSFPAVIAVYWIYNNVLSTGQQLVLKLMYPIPVFTEEDYKEAEKEMNKGYKASKKKSGKKAAHRIDLDEDAVKEAPEIPKSQPKKSYDLIAPANIKDESDKEKED